MLLKIAVGLIYEVLMGAYNPIRVMILNKIIRTHCYELGHVQFISEQLQKVN